MLNSQRGMLEINVSPPEERSYGGQEASSQPTEGGEAPQVGGDRPSGHYGRGLPARPTRVGDRRDRVEKSGGLLRSASLRWEGVNDVRSTPSWRSPFRNAE